MKKIVNSRIFWMIISLLASLILWVYITSLESDQFTRTFRGVEVEFTGESSLKDRGMVITDISSSTVTVEITGPRRTVAALGSSDISAQVNVSTLTQSSVASMQYTIKYPDGTDASNITVTRKIPETVTFTVSNIVSKTIPVRGSFDGSTAEGFIAEEIEFEPATITISGPEIYLNKVAAAWVSFGEENVSSTYTDNVPFVLIDEDKNEIDMTYITCSDEEILCKLPILSLKSIPLNVNVVYGAGADEDNTEIIIEPSSIRLAGDSNILNGLSQITLTTVDLTSFESNYEVTVPIVFDDTLTNIDGINDATVTIKISGLTTQNFNTDNLTCINVTEGYEAEIISKSVDVVLRGTDENLSKVMNEHIRAVIDLTDYDQTEGKSMLTPVIYVDDTEGNSVGAISSGKVEIEIKKVDK